MLNIGDQAPDFTLTDADGRQRTLAQLLQGGPLILYFYPADFTPGCTREACSIRDLHDAISSAGLTVAGISPQDTDSHRRFREQYELPFTLLSDPDKAVIKRYDVDGPLGIGVRRASYLIDEDGRIRDAVLADIRIGRHTAFIEKAVALRESAGS